jgi:starch phosphorylase
MKFALNGALTIGTWDGANIEMAEAIGADDLFVFGLHAEDVRAVRALGYDPRLHYEENRQLRAVIDAIAGGDFSPGDERRYRPLTDALLGQDNYLLLADFASYLEAQARVDALYADPVAWGGAGLAQHRRHGRVLGRPHRRRVRAQDLVAAALSRGQAFGMSCA